MTPDEIHLESLDEAKVHLARLYTDVAELTRVSADHEHRFDTLQTVWWKRLWFRVQRWPGQRDLNADAPGYLPRWLRRIVGQ